jgi:hypothetical protein
MEQSFLFWDYESVAKPKGISFVDIVEYIENAVASKGWVINDGKVYMSRATWPSGMGWKDEYALTLKKILEDKYVYTCVDVISKKKEAVDFQMMIDIMTSCLKSMKSKDNKKNFVIISNDKDFKKIVNAIALYGDAQILMIGSSGEKERAFINWNTHNTTFHFFPSDKQIRKIEDTTTTNTDSDQLKKQEVRQANIQSNKQSVNSDLEGSDLGILDNVILQTIIDKITIQRLIGIINAHCSCDIPDLTRRNLFHNTLVEIMKETSNELDEEQYIYIKKNTFYIMRDVLINALETGEIIRLGVWPVERYTTINLFENVVPPSTINRLISNVAHYQKLKGVGLPLDVAKLFAKSQTDQAVRWGLLSIRSETQELTTNYLAKSSEKRKIEKILGEGIQTIPVDQLELVRESLIHYLDDNCIDKMLVTDMAFLIMENHPELTKKPSYFINQAVDAGYIQRMKSEGGGPAYLYISDVFKN